LEITGGRAHSTTDRWLQGGLQFGGVPLLATQIRQDNAEKPACSRRNNLRCSWVWRKRSNQAIASQDTTAAAAIPTSHRNRPRNRISGKKPSSAHQPGQADGRDTQQDGERARRHRRHGHRIKERRQACCPKRGTAGDSPPEAWAMPIQGSHRWASTLGQRPDAVRPTLSAMGQQEGHHDRNSDGRSEVIPRGQRVFVARPEALDASPAYRDRQRWPIQPSPWPSRADGIGPIGPGCQALADCLAITAARISRRKLNDHRADCCPKLDEPTVTGTHGITPAL